MKAILLAALLSTALAACAAQPRIVKPGQVFGGDYLRIEPPPSGPWEIMDESSSGIVFAKGDRSESESFIAWVSVFPLPATNTPEELEALVREAARRDTDPARFELQREELSYTSERPYPCVRYQSVAKDKTSRAATTPLLLEIYALYCRHPVHTESGFSVIYSHRGVRSHIGLRADAESFIHGVQAPGN